LNRLSLEIRGAEGEIRASKSDDGQIYLVHNQAYEPGDAIVLGCERENVHLVIQLDDAIGPAFVYMTGREFAFAVPFEEKKIAYSPKSFSGNVHVLTARFATEEEIGACRNMALNPYDQHGNQTCFPHASANVETRGESVFAARNAINGNAANDSHGSWPYESWGINRRADAAITVHFGRTVEVNRAALTLRADFPHDNYWERATLSFSDGSRHTADLVKTHQPQIIEFASRKIEWVTLSELIQSDDPSPFPALSQFEVFGRER